ncbi:hypothetical protein QJS10_CPA09g00220 [Acorus calamus]|uniref:Uncharacterized protein n=1 Tax=Acorus calamus TaxID=4465 RepID=A0AAV9E4V4_ACOCL|nr:hypothetical protein QJS10_CPA09g00220 [Acorus calamus]
MEWFVTTYTREIRGIDDGLEDILDAVEQGFSKNQDRCHYVNEGMRATFKEHRNMERTSVQFRVWDSHGTNVMGLNKIWVVHNNTKGSGSERSYVEGSGSEGQKDHT